MADIKYEIRQHEEWTVFVLEGRLDMSNAKDVGDKMNELYECHSRLKRRADQFKNDPKLQQFYSERAEELQDLVIKIIERFNYNMV